MKRRGESLEEYQAKEDREYRLDIERKEVM